MAGGRHPGLTPGPLGPPGADEDGRGSAVEEEEESAALEDELRRRELGAAGAGRRRPPAVRYRCGVSCCHLPVADGAAGRGGVLYLFVGAWAPTNRAGATDFGLRGQLVPIKGPWRKGPR